LWNDPGSGRFIRRGRSTAKGRAISLIDARRNRMIDAARAAWEDGERSIHVRCADNRLRRGNGLSAGDVVEVLYNPDDPSRVRLAGTYEGGRSRWYAVSWDRFSEVVEVDATPTGDPAPETNRAVDVPEVPVVEADVPEVAVEPESDLSVDWSSPESAFPGLVAVANGVSNVGEVDGLNLSERQQLQAAVYDAVYDELGERPVESNPYLPTIFDLLRRFNNVGRLSRSEDSPVITSSIYVDAIANGLAEVRSGLTRPVSSGDLLAEQVVSLQESIASRRRFASPLLAGSFDRNDRDALLRIAQRGRLGGQAVSDADRETALRTIFSGLTNDELATLSNDSYLTPAFQREVNRTDRNSYGRIFVAFEESSRYQRFPDATDEVAVNAREDMILALVDAFINAGATADPNRVQLRDSRVAPVPAIGVEDVRARLAQGRVVYTSRNVPAREWGDLAVPMEGLDDALAKRVFAFTLEGDPEAGTPDIVARVDSTTPLGLPDQPYGLIVQGTFTAQAESGPYTVGSFTRTLSPNGTLVDTNLTINRTPDTVDQNIAERFLASSLERARTEGFVEATFERPHGAVHDGGYSGLAEAGYDWQPGSTDHLRVATWMSDYVDNGPGGESLDRALIDRLLIHSGPVPDRPDEDFPTPFEVSQSPIGSQALDTLGFNGQMFLVDPVDSDVPVAIEETITPVADVPRGPTPVRPVLITGGTLGNMFAGEFSRNGRTVEARNITVYQRGINKMESADALSLDDAVTVEGQFIDTGNDEAVRRFRADINLQSGEINLDFPGDEFSGYEPAFVQSLVGTAASNGFVQIVANGQMDGVTAALSGFDWRVGGTSGRQRVFSDLRDLAASETDLSDKVRQQVDDLVRNGTVGLGSEPASWPDTLPTPFDVATVGWTPGADNWLGKRVLAQGRFSGIIRLDQEAFDSEDVAGIISRTIEANQGDTAPDRFRVALSQLETWANRSATAPYVNAAYEQIAGRPFIENDASTVGRTISEALAIEFARRIDPAFEIGPKELRIPVPRRQAARQMDAMDPLTLVDGDLTEADRQRMVESLVPSSFVSVAVDRRVATTVRVEDDNPVSIEVLSDLYVGNSMVGTAIVSLQSGSRTAKVDIDTLAPGDSGYAVQAMQATIERLRESGYQQVNADTGFDSSLSAFDFAMMGFDFAEGSERHRELATLLRERAAFDGVNADVANEAIRIADAFERVGPLDAPETLPNDFPTLADVAKLGWQSFETTWFGKEILEGLPFEGRLDIGTPNRPAPYQEVLRFVPENNPQITVTDDLIRSIYDIDLGDGYRSTVRPSGSGAYGDILSPTGSRIGAFNRTLSSNGYISHSSFSVNSSHRGRGIGSRFIGRSVENARRAGFNTIGVSAAAGGGYNGSYTWARTGFDWSNQFDPQSFARRLRQLASDDTASYMTPALKIEAMEMADRLEVSWEGNYPPEDFPTPNDVAVLGWEVTDGTGESWLGKKVMSTNGWSGRMLLTPTAPGPVMRTTRRVPRPVDLNAVDVNERLANRIFNRTVTSDGIEVEARVTETRSLTPDGLVDHLLVRGELIDTANRESRTGGVIGTFSRKLGSDGTAYLDQLTLAPSYQNRGIGMAYQESAIGAIESNGFNRVVVDAQSGGPYNGAYTWARAGFDWSYQTEGRSIGEALRGAAESATLDTDTRAAVNDIADRLNLPWNADGTPPENYPTPNDVAMIGWSYGADTWFGREFLLGRTGTETIVWQGAIQLNPPIVERDIPWSYEEFSRGRALTGRRAAERVVRGERLWDPNAGIVATTPSEFAAARLQQELDSLPTPAEVRQLVNFQDRINPDGLSWSDWHDRYLPKYGPVAMALVRNASLRRRQSRDDQKRVKLMMRDENALRLRFDQYRREARPSASSSAAPAVAELDPEYRGYVAERVQAQMSDPVFDVLRSDGRRRAAPIVYSGPVRNAPRSSIAEPLRYAETGNGQSIVVHPPEVDSDIRATGVPTDGEMVTFRGREMSRAAVIDLLIREGLYGALWQWLQSNENTTWRTQFNDEARLLQQAMSDSELRENLLLSGTNWVSNEQVFTALMEAISSTAYLPPEMTAIRDLVAELRDGLVTGRVAAVLPEDGDGDGVIFDGTKKEMPAPTKALSKIDLDALRTRRTKNARKSLSDWTNEDLQAEAADLNGGASTDGIDWSLKDVEGELARRAKGRGRPEAKPVTPAPKDVGDIQREQIGANLPKDVLEGVTAKKAPTADNGSRDTGMSAAQLRDEEARARKLGNNRLADALGRQAKQKEDAATSVERPAPVVTPVPEKPESVEAPKAPTVKPAVDKNGNRRVPDEQTGVYTPGDTEPELPGDADAASKPVITPADGSVLTADTKMNRPTFRDVVTGKNTDAETVAQARAVTEATQDELARAGIDHVVLYRGVPADEASDPFRFNPTDRISTTRRSPMMRPASGVTSWTTDREVAEEYGQRVVKAVVPRELILSWDGVGAIATTGEADTSLPGREVLVARSSDLVDGLVGADFVPDVSEKPVVEAPSAPDVTPSEPEISDSIWDEPALPKSVTPPPPTPKPAPVPQPEAKPEPELAPEFIPQRVGQPQELPGVGYKIDSEVETRRRAPNAPSEEWSSLVRGDAENKMRIRVPDGALESLFEDGRFKTQFETGASRGTLDTSNRRRAERSMFGIMEDLPDSQRPIYGFVDDPKAQDRTVGYGGVVLHVKPEVAERTTVAFGDSLGDALNRQVAPVSLADAKIADDERLGYARSMSAGNLQYVEAQYHGGLSTDDLEPIIELDSRNSTFSDGPRMDQNVDVDTYDRVAEFAGRKEFKLVVHGPAQGQSEPEFQDWMSKQRARGVNVVDARNPDAPVDATDGGRIPDWESFDQTAVDNMGADDIRQLIADHSGEMPPEVLRTLRWELLTRRREENEELRDMGFTVDEGDASLPEGPGGVTPASSPYKVPAYVAPDSPGSSVSTNRGTRPK
jgi:GNAT superfamily N-acetyltransferase